jgi:hypothetical protein
MLILLGVTASGLGLAAAATSLRAPAHRISLECLGAALFVAGLLLASLGTPFIAAVAW